MNLGNSVDRISTDKISATVLPKFTRWNFRNGAAEIRKRCLRYPERRKILVQILLIRKLYLHLQSQGEFA